MFPVLPIRYVEPVYRPPSEAESLILPLTDGCSWNHCTFCEMYTAPQKRFRARDEAEVLESIERTGERFGSAIRRVFLADGDALVLPTRRLLKVLNAIRKHLPAVRRVSSYCLPRNLRKKSIEELRELAAAGLAIAYVGAESGDDEVLKRVNKGETHHSTLDALNKLGAAGIKRSVMILNGLAGPDLSLRHADQSARLVNATQPEYLATLVVSFPLGEERFAWWLSGLAGTQPARTVCRNGAFSCRAGTRTDGVSQRPRFELAGSQGNAWRRQGSPAAAGARRHRQPAGRSTASSVGTRAVVDGDRLRNAAPN
jgi:radical SAM superfamily enzyme YgiQ (UPF0313 family)